MKTLKTFSVAALILLGTATSQAQKFYEFVFCNTLDEGIGSTCALDESRIINEFGSIAERIGLEPVERFFHGNECSKENLLKELNNLNCTKDDVVLFYYSGHGVHAEGGRDDKFPQMCLKYNIRDQANFVPVRQVQEIISKKNQRLAIILTDCCNDIDESGFVSVKGIAQERGVQVIKRSADPNYRRLFSDAEGIVTATGCKLGQTSKCNNLLGGFFTYHFLNQLNEICNGSGKATWGTLLDNVKNEVASFTNNTQEPYFVSNIKQEGGGSTGGNANPTPIQPSANFTSFQEALESLLRTTDMTARRNLLPRIKQRCFNGGSATIITVGRNLTTVVDYEDLDTYLNRLAANKKIIRISVIKDVTDNQGKRFITVTETRTE